MDNEVEKNYMVNIRRNFNSDHENKIFLNIIVIMKKRKMMMMLMMMMMM